MDCPTRFYSPFISGMQRLPNGNTLITEGSDGRVFEVTKDHELVWEFISPYWGQKLPMNMVYRAYRVPYEWVPQLGKQEETPIERIDVNAFRMPGAAALGDRDSEIAIEGCAPYEGDNALCVASVDDPEDQIKKHGRGTGASPVPLPANGLLHVLRFSTISSRLPPPREEPGPCPGSLRFHAALSRSQKNGGPATSRSGSLPSRRKRKYGKRPCIRGTLPTAPASPLTASHC